MRNTLLFISFLAIIAALLFGFNLGRWYTPPPHTTPTPPPQVQPQPKIVTYTNTTCGISLQYPQRLTKLEATAGALFVDAQNASDSVALTCQEKIPLPALVPEKIEQFTVTATTGATLSAKLYHDASPKDGTPIDKLIFTHPTNGFDILLAGFGKVFQEILASLKLQ